MEVLETIKQQLSDNPVVLYMKGTPDRPQCGFSATAVKCLQACGVPFASVDVLANPEIRKALPIYSDWPTFPQLYVQASLIGGSDILADMHATGELKILLHNAINPNQ